MSRIADDLAAPKSFLRACLLLLLHERPSHGYDLIERLKPFGFDWGGPGPIYQHLHGLESANFVSSSLEFQLAGSPRRVYGLTARGEDELQACLGNLKNLRDRIECYVQRAEVRSKAEARPGRSDDERPALGLADDLPGGARRPERHADHRLREDEQYPEPETVAAAGHQAGAGREKHVDEKGRNTRDCDGWLDRIGSSPDGDQVIGRGPFAANRDRPSLSS